MPELGKAALHLLSKPYEKITVVDLQREMQKSTLKEIDNIIASHKTYNDKYFIHILQQRDRLLPNVIKQKFVVRKTRPAPFYDATLYSYNNSTSTLLYEWTIPDEETCQFLLANASSLRKEENGLLDFVQKFAEGNLV